MEFGIILPVSGAFAGRENIVRAALEAESLGFEAVGSYDFSLIQTRESHRAFVTFGTTEAIQEDAEPDFHEPLTTLAFLAGQTSSVRLATSAFELPLRNPISVAKEAASLDVLSNGRLDFGVCIAGVPSYVRSDFEALHFPIQKRGQMFEEYVRAIREIWSKPKASFHGKYVDFTDLEFYPKPIGARIWIASGVSERGVRRVAELGDGWLAPIAKADEIRRGIELIRDEAGKFGKDGRSIGVSYMPYISLGETESDAWRTISKTLEVRTTGFGGQSISTDSHVRGVKVNSYEDYKSRFLIGTVDQIIKRVDEYDAAGVQRLMLMFAFPGAEFETFTRHLRQFAGQVIRSFR